MIPSRIMIVEDEWLIAEQLEGWLVDFGFTVVGPARNLQEALSLLETDSPDAAILDVNLGGAKSYAIAHVLAERGKGFVFASGYLRSDLPTEFAGVQLISKPVQSHHLQAALAKILPKQRH